MKRPDRSARKSTSSPPPDPAGARWLLLIHQIPPKPDYLRVKIGRRLQRVGAVAIKNSVYALPAGPEPYEDLQWIIREIKEGGGDAFVSEALLGDGLTDEAVRARFDAARNEEYRAILADARALIRATRGSKTQAARRSPKVNGAPRRPALEHELAKLRRRFEAASAIDFFGATEQGTVSAALIAIQAQLRQQANKTVEQRAARPLHGAVWVTRQDVHADRVASAWLIRRFIDSRPRFRFVDPTRHKHRKGELRFDMFDGEYTHVGDACTFETLRATFVPDDGALREIAEIVHDIDCKDAKFRRDEAAGVARVIAGIATRYQADEDRVEQAAALFENLYAAFGRSRPT
jgi:hypothetical protein